MVPLPQNPPAGSTWVTDSEVSGGGGPTVRVVRLYPTVEALNAFPQLLEFLLAAILPPDRDPNSATIGQLLWSRTAAAAIGSPLGRCVNDDHDRDD